eukprot:CAMPEP_0168610012 /NCGR_PEP_ID=MMETSP0449_2-20121227/1534_1 /TAXON_ID=1082188 /ORGANISM="Strombidium rassoulzadegani, Strain ras09" /LENGTH=73 /DNA_ID=CAMNT_0008650237 /DNA_START=334 /DNA_END=555 /DNA_ORIENTATION=-
MASNLSHQSVKIKQAGTLIPKSPTHLNHKKESAVAQSKAPSFSAQSRSIQGYMFKRDQRANEAQVHEQYLVVK